MVSLLNKLLIVQQRSVYDRDSPHVEMQLAVFLFAVDGEIKRADSRHV